jgi:hypothetical protein
VPRKGLSGNLHKASRINNLTPSPLSCLYQGNVPLSSHAAPNGPPASHIQTTHQYGRSAKPSVVPDEVAPTASAELLLKRIRAKVDNLCRERDNLTGLGKASLVGKTTRGTRTGSKANLAFTTLLVPLSDQLARDGGRVFDELR